MTSKDRKWLRRGIAASGERLKWLGGRASALATSSRGRRFMLVGAILLVFAFASLDIPTTNVSLQVRSSSIAFTSLERAPLLSPLQAMPLESIRVSGLSEVILPTDVGGRRSYRGGDLTLKVALDPSVDRSVMSLETPIVEVGQRVSLRSWSRSSGWSLELSPSGESGGARSDRGEAPPVCQGQEARVSFQGGLSYRLDGTDEVPPDSVQSSTPQAIILCSNEAEAIRLELEAKDDSPAVLAWQLGVRDLSFEALEDLELPDGESVRRRFSSLVSGRLRFDDVPGRSQEIWRGERLRLRASEGTLQTVELEQGLLRIGFAGAVGDVERVERRARTLMPNWIDYVLARPVYRFVLGILASIVFFALGIGKVLGSPLVEIDI